MRVLVDGDRGYIGAVLVPFVQAAGHEVVGLDVGWYDGCDFGVQPEGYEQRTGDIRDVTPETSRDSTRSSILRRSRMTRSATSTRRRRTRSMRTAQVHMAKTAKAAGVTRFLFSSSCSLYGAAGDKPC
jgi:nucleoside-diphosphate-sugar epimerase